MTEKEEQAIVDKVEQRVLEKLEKAIGREDTQKVLSEPRNKWFKDANGSGTDSLMAKALGNSFIAWSAWEQICQMIYDIAMNRRTI